MFGFLSFLGAIVVFSRARFNVVTDWIEETLANRLEIERDRDGETVFPLHRQLLFGKLHWRWKYAGLAPLLISLVGILMVLTLYSGLPFYEYVAAMGGGLIIAGIVLVFDRMGEEAVKSRREEASEFASQKAKALHNAKPTESIGVIIDAIKNLSTPNRAALLPLLDEVSIERAKGAYLATLREFDEEAVLLAAKILHRRLPEELTQFLPRLLRSDSTELRQVAYNVLSQQSYEKQAELYRDLLSRGTEERRQEALRIVETIQPFRIDDLITLTHHEWPRLRLAAYRALSRISDERIEGVLWNGADDPDPQIQKMCWAGLAGRGFSDKYLTQYQDLMTNDMASLRKLGAKALSTFVGKPSAVQAMTTLSHGLGDGDVGVRIAASDSLARFGDAAIPVLEHQLSIGGPEQFSAIRTLAQMATVASWRRLAQFTDHPDERARRMAIQAEQLLAAEEVLPLLREGLNDNDPIVVNRAIEKAGDLSDVRLVPDLVALIEKMHKLGTEFNVDRESVERHAHKVLVSEIITLERRSLLSGAETLWCEACLTRAVVHRPKAVHGFVYVACRKCNDVRNLRRGVGRVIGLIGDELSGFTDADGLIYLAWDESTKQARVADYDCIILSDPNEDNDWAVAALLQALTSQAFPPERLPAFVLTDGVTLSANTLRLLGESNCEVLTINEWQRAQGQAEETITGRFQVDQTVTDDLDAQGSAQTPEEPRRLAS